MRTFDYYTRHGPSAILDVLYLTVPIAAPGISFIIVANGVAEPFAALTALDVAIFVGGPLALVAITIIWLRLAAKRRTNIFVILFVLGWFLLNIFVGIDSLLAYLHEPWNQ